MKSEGSSICAPALIVVLAMASLPLGCRPSQRSPETETETNSSFGSDVAFLRSFTEIIVLEDSTGNAKAAISPALQGRIMTSTASGNDGPAFGWINREAFNSGDTSAHMNAFGGEDRFWLGPEGGQFSVYFEKGAPFDLEHWHVPPIIDIEPFETVSVERSRALFARTGQLTNYSGTLFQFAIDREIRLFERARAVSGLNVDPTSQLEIVAIESVNTLRNTGTDSWKSEHGLLSIWILGMYNPSENTVVIIPYRGKSNTISGVVNDNYFGRIPADRLIVSDGVIYFKGDGRFRSKIGLSASRATDWLGSYNPGEGALTLVHYNKPETESPYVNSAWEIQQKPYDGDVVNAYNDGEPSPGAKPLGPFYELETSSPAIELAPGQSVTHVHTTYHLKGTPSELDPVMMRFLGVTTAEVADAFK